MPFFPSGFFGTGSSSDVTYNWHPSTVIPEVESQTRMYEPPPPARETASLSTVVTVTTSNDAPFATTVSKGELNWSESDSQFDLPFRKGIPTLPAGSKWPEKRPIAEPGH